MITDQNAGAEMTGNEPSYLALDDESLTTGPPKRFEETTGGKTLLCFSAYTNFGKLFASRSGNLRDPLESLNAVRVMAMGWVILGHTFLFRMINVPFNNPQEIGHSFKQKETILIYGAFYAVDTFFWLSGLLMALLFIKELVGRKGRLNWPLVYFHRFWRILPIYMFVLFLTWAFVAYVGDGPIFW
jgi:peptidoglycan/LPS O-acetylase OafA/YrhL